MSFEGFEDPDFDDEDEPLEEIPEVELPEFEEIFQTDVSGVENLQRREGADRIAKPVLGKLAKARLIAARSKQLELGAPPAIPRDRLVSGELQEIAKQELKELVLPIKIIRKFADGMYEVWPLSDFLYIAE